MTIWAYYDMEFSERTTLQDLINLHAQLRLGGRITIRKQLKSIERKKFNLFFVFNEEKPYLCCKKS